jgi:hypothetical protein
MSDPDHADEGDAVDDADEADEPDGVDEAGGVDEADGDGAADDGAVSTGAPVRVVPVDTHDGDRLLVWSWAGTALFAVTAFAAVAVDALMAVSTPVAIVLFLLGCVLFVRAFLYAVSERRTDLIGIGGLFFLAGSAPRRVQKQLLGSLGVEVVVAIATASLRPYTALAFGALVPMYGLGLAGLWAARYGTFPSRPPDTLRPRTR